MSIPCFIAGHTYRWECPPPENDRTLEYHLGWSRPMLEVLNGLPFKASHPDTANTQCDIDLNGSLWYWNQEDLNHFIDVTDEIGRASTDPIRSWRFVVDGLEGVYWDCFQEAPWFCGSRYANVPRLPSDIKWTNEDRVWLFKDPSNIDGPNKYRYFVGVCPPKGMKHYKVTIDSQFAFNYEKWEPFVPDPNMAVVECHHCQSSHYDNGFEHDGSHFCETCQREAFRTCRDCGERYYSQDHECNNFERLCPNCAPNYVSCESCGDFILRGDSQSRWGYHYCERCFNDSIIHDHSWNPKKFLYYGNADECFLGMELEIEGGDGGASIISNFNPDESRLYMKHDGSLNDDGVEIVTHPHTYAELVKLDWEGLFRRLISAGYTSHDNGDCGLHFHLTRSFLGKEGVSKLVYLTEKFKDKFFTFSRRTRDSFNQWAKCYFDSTQRRNLQENALKLGNMNVNYDRYRMVNITNEHTIEIRFIRGTLRYDTWLASAQLAHTMAHICHTEDWESVKSMGFLTIIKYFGFKEIAEYWESRKRDPENDSVDESGEI